MIIILRQQQQKTKTQKVHISMCSWNTIIRYYQPRKVLNQTPFCILGNFSWLEATHQCISNGCNGHTLEKPYTRPCPSTPPWILYSHQLRALSRPAPPPAPPLQNWPWWSCVIGGLGLRFSPRLHTMIPMMVLLLDSLRLLYMYLG